MPSNSNSGGNHSHGITKPTYTRETMMRNLAGQQVSLGGALANQSSTAQDLYSENSDSETQTGGIAFDWIAIAP
jgi:hypothetical protein